MMQAETQPRLTVPVSRGRDHIQGAENAPVTLVEYGDYECPYCGAAYPVVREIQQQSGSELRFVFRNFPITSSHPHAEAAAEAAEAAAAQGHFWEMHDQLFEHQDQLGLPHRRRYAREIGLNLKQFDYDLAGHVHARKVRDDFMGVCAQDDNLPKFRSRSPMRAVVLLDSVGVAQRRKEEPGHGGQQGRR